MKKDRLHPGLALLCIAPVMGELVSGHQSLLEFINPLNFLLLALPYGFGALLCRELMIRWRKGWLCLLLLGLGLGIYEEALVARSIWDPEWAELGAVRDYSFWRGMAWTYAAVLLHFHVTVSIGASVVIAHLLYPARRHEKWLNSSQMLGWVLGLASWLPALALLNPFVPPTWASVAACLAIASLTVLARRLSDPAMVPGAASPAPLWYALVAFMNTTVVFVVVFLLPELAPEWLPPWPASLGFVIVADTAALWLILRWSGGTRGWDDRHKLMLVSGVLGFFIVFDAGQDFESEFDGGIIVALLTVAGLWWLWRATSRRVES